MTARSIPAIALVALWAAAGPAHAAGLVYGGTTRDGDAIVLTAPKGAAKLAGAVIAWQAVSDDQSYFSDAEQVTAAKLASGEPVGPRDLVMTRNAKGRFTGTQAFGERSGSDVAMISLTVTGRLTRTRASGTLSAVVKITDTTTGASAGSCQTGTVSWAAAHDPGRVYTAAYSDGTKRAFSYDLRGRVSKTAAHGTLHVTTADTDAAGAPGMTCDSGTIAWTAVTG